MQETLDAQSADIDMVSGATVTSDGYLGSPQGRPGWGRAVTRAAADTVDTACYVEHVMGMPISLVLRGRHTTDEAARTAWAAVSASLRDADRVFSTYRHHSFVSRLSWGDLDVVDCPSEVGEVLAAW